MSDELKPCPFCGGEAIETEHAPHDHSALTVAITGLPGRHPGSWSIECVVCSCGMLHANRHDARAAWNRRAPVAARPATSGREARMREAFEAWAAIAGNSIKLDRKGRYADVVVGTAWLGWKSGWASRPTAQASECRHRLVDARNPVVQSGYLCIDCGAVFSAADHDGQKASDADCAALLAERDGWKQQAEDNATLMLKMAAERDALAAQVEAMKGDAEDAVRLEWVANAASTWYRDFAVHVMRVGGMGGLDDLRVFIDAARQETKP